MNQKSNTMTPGQKNVRKNYLKDMKNILHKKTDDLADVQNLKASTIKFLALLQKEEDKILSSSL